MYSHELLRDFRQDVYDLEEPPIWGDELLYRYLNDGLRRFVKDIGGIAETSGEYSSLPVYRGEARVTLDPLVAHISAASFEDGHDPLRCHPEHQPGDPHRPHHHRHRSLKIIDAPHRADSFPEAHRFGRPHSLILGAAKGEALLVPIPEMDGTLYLSIARKAQGRIDGEGQEIIDVGDEYAPALIEYMKFRAFNVPDTDGFNPDGARQSWQLYERYVIDAKRDKNRLEYVPTGIRYGGL